MENLNTQILSGVPIPVLDVTEQAEICEALTEQLEVLEALASEAVIGVQLPQERRATLISAAVTGQIDVRGLVPCQD
jgi:type I restriction enzyme, S subunit